MHIKITRAGLFHQIQCCQSIVEKRSTNPLLANIHFEALDQSLKLTATDLQSTYASSFEAEVITAGKFTVEAKKIFEIVRELNPEHKIELKLEDSFLVIVSSGIKFRLATQPADEFPSEPNDETDLTLTMSGSELSRMIASTSFAMSDDETRKYLTGTFFEVTASHGIRLVTTDGHRMALSEMTLEGQTEETTCIVPKKAVLALKRLADEADDQLQLSLGKNQVRIALNQQRFTSKVIDAKYPVYEDVIPKNNPYVATVEKSALDQALRRSMVVSNDYTHDVKLSFSADKLIIAAHNTEHEQAEEEMTIDYSGSAIEIGFNAKYMRDVLSAIQSQRIRIQLKDSLSPALILEESHELARHVLMPMRI